ncbi:MAG: hypothetical protein EZS28_013224 [Streblomastix strix]|uniref:Uncharacterized protein n=1 Tax=Streblomastix strix TaxID=222440 RepID=A0A5J4W8Q7_9EUKA|nr:MAG: hypothetical protein EZS28_013224 [Streblomastix strix]
MTGLIAIQQALLVAMENGFDGHNNIEKIAHVYAMLCVGLNAVTQLRQLANAPQELKRVVGGSILPADIFIDNVIESIKRYLELKKVDQLHFQYQQGHYAYPLVLDPVTIVAPFGIQQTQYTASKFSYGRVAAAGRGFQQRGRGGRGRGAFGSNFMPLGGQQVSVKMNVQSQSTVVVNDSGEQGSLRKNKYGQNNQDRMLCEMKKRGEQDNFGMVTESDLFRRERGVSATIGLIDKGRIESGNNFSFQLIGNPTVEQKICDQETGRRIEKNNGLLTSEYVIVSSTFQNE